MSFNNLRHGCHLLGNYLVKVISLSKSNERWSVHVRSTAQGSAFRLAVLYVMLQLGIFLVAKMNVIHPDRWVMAFFAKSIELPVCQQKYLVATRQGPKHQHVPLNQIVGARLEIVPNVHRTNKMPFLRL